MEQEQLRYKVVVDDNNKGVVDECDLVMSRNSSGSSLESDSFEETTSPPSSTSSSADGADPLNDMSSLIQQLPIKRGLSKYYQGKAQSFTSLEKVKSLEDLAKPENPFNKKMKSCRSFGGRMDERGLHQERGGDKIIMYRRPPIPSHTSTPTIPNHTALYV